jgi:site-specific DNA recombinase
MQTAVLYARVSSREQQEEGYSIEAQVKLLRAFALKSGIEIVQEFIEVASAATPGRKRFGDMVNFLRTSKECRTILVEKSDRLSRNFEDDGLLKQLDLETHYVKSGSMFSKGARASTKFLHNVELATSVYFSDNLCEEVKKGMHEKASQGIFPARAPFGYRNNKAERTIEVHPTNSLIVNRMFELYATGAHTLSTLAQAICLETSKKFSRGGVHLILKNEFYMGTFEWGKQTYPGTQTLFVNPKAFAQVQAVLAGHNRPKYSKREIAFRGVMTCGYDGCMVTGEIKKQKYVYYHCTQHRGKCSLPWFREEDIAKRLGEPLKGLQVPKEVVAQIVSALQDDQANVISKASGERSRLDARLTAILGRMDRAYSDKLDGIIPDDLWERKMSDWRMEQQQVRMAIQGLNCAETSDRALDAQKILELANVAYSLYVSQDSAEKVKLIRMLFSNCVVDAVSVTPTYRKPFDMIFERARLEEWSGRLDSN